MSNSFFPPERILMGPGPSNLNPRVLEALSRPTIGHLDPAFVHLMDEIKGLLQYAFQTENQLTIPVSAPGSSGMEACFVNLLEPGDKVVICQNGVFGGRMKENAIRCGAETVMVEDPWGEAIDLEKVEAALKAHSDAKVLAFVHAETSTGACSDVKGLCELARKYDCLTIADTVTSLGGVELRVDEWGIDAVYSGTQKCLSCVPGLSPVTFSEQAVHLIRNRKTPVQSWFLDMNLVMGYWGQGVKRAYHHTAPINPLYALHEALLMLKEEGLENAWARHALHHRALAAGLKALGIEMAVSEYVCLPQLNAVTIPDGVDDAAVRGQLLNEFNLEIGAGLGALAGKVWRIGLMGNTANRNNVLLCLSALSSVLEGSGIKANANPIEAASAIYRSH